MEAVHPQSQGGGGVARSQKLSREESHEAGSQDCQAWAEGVLLGWGWEYGEKNRTRNSNLCGV